MVAFRFQNVCIESYSLVLPPIEVTSAELEDRLAPLYERLKVPFGTLEKLSGIKTRRYWPMETAPSVGSTAAAEEALEGIGFDRSAIGAVVNCSVTRDYFEPSTGCIVHSNLGMPEDVLALDITNACIGFSNGIQMIGNLIETGVIKAGVVTTGENIACVVEKSIELMLKNGDTIERDELLKLLPSLTLGCGAASMVLCHKSIATRGHRVVGNVSRCATQHKDLCKGNGDFYILQQVDFNPIMHTDSQQLMSQAAKLGGRMWKDFEESIGWQREAIDHIFCHQVGKQVNQNFYKEMTLDMEKEFTVYPYLGNLVSAAVPAALFTGIKEKNIQQGEKILLTAFGSGLNSIFTGIEW